MSDTSQNCQIISLLSVLNYGSEISGFHPGDEIDRVHTKFCNRFLKAKKCTLNFMVYSELGRLPLSVIRKLRNKIFVEIG